MNDDQDWKPEGKSLTPDGRLTGETPLPRSRDQLTQNLREKRTDEYGRPKLDALTTGELQLDTSTRVKVSKERADGYEMGPPEARRSKKALLAVLGLLVLGSLLGAAVVLKPGLLHLLPVLPGAKHTVLITSEPSGAKVKIGESVVGVTPWAADNVWSAPAPIVVEFPGFKPWKGTLEPGKDVQLTLELKRK